MLGLTSAARTGIERLLEVPAGRRPMAGHYLPGLAWQDSAFQAGSETSRSVSPLTTARSVLVPPDIFQIYVVELDIENLSRVGRV